MKLIAYTLKTGAGIKGNQVKVLSGRATVIGELQLISHWYCLGRGVVAFIQEPGNLPVLLETPNLREKGRAGKLLFDPRLG